MCSRWRLSACRRNLPAPSSRCLYPEDGAASSSVTLLAICQATRRHISGGHCENLRSHTVHICFLINDVVRSWLSHGSCIYIKAFPINAYNWQWSECIYFDWSSCGYWSVCRLFFWEVILKPVISKVLNRAVVWCCWNTGDPHRAELTGLTRFWRVYSEVYFPLSISLCFSVR